MSETIKLPQSITALSLLSNAAIGNSQRVARLMLLLPTVQYFLTNRLTKNFCLLSPTCSLLQLWIYGNRQRPNHSLLPMILWMRVLLLVLLGNINMWSFNHLLVQHWRKIRATNASNVDTEKTVTMMMAPSKSELFLLKRLMGLFNLMTKPLMHKAKVTDLKRRELDFIMATLPSFVSDLSSGITPAIYVKCPLVDDDAPYSVIGQIKLMLLWIISNLTFLKSLTS